MCPAEQRERARLAGKLTVWTRRVLVPSKRSWTITLPWLKNPFSIANKISGYNLWRQNLACYEISTNKIKQMMNWRWVEVGVQTETQEPGKTMSSRQNVALRSRRSAGHTTIYLNEFVHCLWNSKHVKSHCNYFITMNHSFPCYWALGRPCASPTRIGLWRRTHGLYNLALLSLLYEIKNEYFRF